MTESLIEYLQRIICKGGYQIKINDNMNELMETLLHVDGKKTGNPEFDPVLHDLNKDNSLWIELRDEAGDVVATSAARLLQTHDLVGLTRSYRLWYGDRIRFTDRLNIVLDSNVTVPTGRLVLDGAMWVRTDQRRRGFSWILARLLKALAFGRWNPDWYFGIAFQSIAKSRLPIYSYGYPRLDPFAEGYHVPGYASQSLSLASMSRSEYVYYTAQDTEFLTASQDLAVGPELALRVKARRHDVQAPVRRKVPEADFGLAS